MTTTTFDFNSPEKTMLTPTRLLSATALLCFAAAGSTLAAGTALAAADAAPAETLPAHGIPPLSQEFRAQLAETATPDKPKAGEISFSGIYYFDTEQNMPGQTGWGGTLDFNVLLARDAKYPNTQLKFGFGILGFHIADNHGLRGDVGGFSFNGGVSHTFFDHLEIGADAGIGIAGSYCETYKHNGHRDYNGNVNWAFHVRPTIAFHITKSVSIAASYRLDFITPIIRTEYDFLSKNDLEYKTIDIVAHGIDISLRLRF
jgi:hypothetical protein